MNTKDMELITHAIFKKLEKNPKQTKQKTL